jgi:hypothetical protein
MWYLLIFFFELLVLRALGRMSDCQQISTIDKNISFVEDHPMNIPTKFGSNWLSVFVILEKKIKM